MYNFETKHTQIPKLYSRIDLAATRKVHRNIPESYNAGGISDPNYSKHEEIHSRATWERQCLLIRTILRRPELGALTRLLRWTLLPVPHGLPEARITSYDEGLSFNAPDKRRLSLPPHLRQFSRPHSIRFNEGSGM